MSPPQGPRDSGNNRGRARPRGIYRTRGGRNETVEDKQSPKDRGGHSAPIRVEVKRRAPQLTRDSDSPSRQARTTPPRQNEGRSSKQRPREAAPPPAHRHRTQYFPRTSPASPPVSPQDASWRNPVVEPLGSYQKHMFDLYQTVSGSTS